MADILLYLIKSLLAGALLLGFYQLFMRKESYFRLNRYYLLISALLIVFLPLLGSFIPLNLFSSGKEAAIPVITLPEVVITADRLMSPEQQQEVVNWALIGYLMITLAMIGGLLVSLVRILKFYRTATSAHKLDRNLYMLPESGSPFSFLGKIFISKEYADHPNLKQILVHENAHIRQKHLADLLLLELFSCIFWFNPFLFLIKRAMREVHEYLADREVIQQGAEPLAYQQLLFNEVSGNPQYIIANNFNLLTKKRIIMLIKKSSKIAALRIGILMPVIVSAVVMIALLRGNTLIAQNQEPPKPPSVPEAPPPPPPPADLEQGKPVKDKQGKEVYTVVEQMPEYPGGDEARSSYMVSNIKYPKAAREAGIQGTVYVTYIVEADGSITNAKVIKGIGAGCDEESIRVVTGMPRWKPGMAKGKAVRVQFTMPIKFALSNDKVKGKSK